MQNLAVAADMHQVGVLVHHPHPGHILPCSDLHQDVKGVGGVQRQNGHPLLGQIFLHRFHILFRHMGDALQLGLGLGGYRSHRCRHLQATSAPGVGHHHTLDILNDVAADVKRHLLGQLPQGLASHRTGIGHRNGLGTPHGGLQLLSEDLHIRLISLIGPLHGAVSPYLAFFFILPQAPLHRKRHFPVTPSTARTSYAYAEFSSAWAWHTAAETPRWTPRG